MTIFREDQLWWLVLFGMPVLLFRDFLFGDRVLIGDIDRLDVFLNFLIFHVESLKAGRIDAWFEGMFGGLNSFSFGWSFPNPLTLLTALFPLDSIFAVASATSCALVIAAGWAAYALIRSYAITPFASFVGAALYQLSNLVTFNAAQNDMTVAVFVIVPLAMLLLAMARQGNLAHMFGGISLLVMALLSFMFLHTAAYTLMLLGCFALYLAVKKRDWRIVAVFSMATALAILGAFPRLFAVAREFLLLERNLSTLDIGTFEALYEYQNIRSYEILRWLDYGIFGRFPSEAREIGNNINLSEGMLLGSSVLAVCAVAWLCVRIWFRRPFFYSADALFMFAVLVISVGVIVSPMLLSFFYFLFLDSNLTHARILTIGLLPFSVLVALFLEDLAGVERISPRHWGVGIIGAFIIMAGINSVAVGNPAHQKISMYQSAGGLISGAFALLSGGRYNPDASVPNKPSTLLGYRVEPGAVRLYWTDVAGEARYKIEMSTNAEKFTEIGFGGKDTQTYEIRNLAPEGMYSFRIAACAEAACSSYTNAVDLPPGVSAPSKDDLKALGSIQRDVWLAGEAVVRIVLVFGIFAAGMALLWALRRQYNIRAYIIAGVGMLLVLDVFHGANVRYNGAHLASREVPFFGNDMLVAGEREFLLPSTEAINKIATRLEASDFRSVSICPLSAFPGFCAPHLSAFWKLRLLDGYSSGLPEGLAALPWPAETRGLRTITFSASDKLPWDILSLLNVKYAVVVSNAFYRNTAAAMPAGSATFDPETLEVIENPLPVVPRDFFIRKATPVKSNDEAVNRLFSNGKRVRDVIEESFVEGLEQTGDFAIDGRANVFYEGDKITILLDPSERSRFLVLNERPHPDWRAYSDGKEIQIYTVNAAMRGVPVGPGIGRIDMEFKPLLKRYEGTLFLVAFLLLLSGGYFWLRKWDRRR